MKTTVIVVAALLAASFSSAQSLPSVPSDSVEWRMNTAGFHLQKAGRSTGHAVIAGLIGGTMTYLFSKDEEVSDGLKAGMAAGTIVGVFAFTINGAAHQKRAGDVLRKH